MAYLMTVFYKNYLHSDFDMKRHTFFFILPVYLHLLPVFFCNHYARAAASDVTVTSTLNWSIGGMLNPIGKMPKTHYKKEFCNGFTGKS